MKRTLTLLLAFSIVASSTVSAQRYRKGLSLEAVMPKTVKIYDPEEFGFSGELPKSYSLKEYAPYPQNQGEYSTCVGWAFGYASMSIMYAEKFNIKNRNYITAAAMCPYTVYNDVKDEGDASCQEGTYLHLAADLLQKKGTKRLYLEENGCSKSSKKDPIYRVFKVESYSALWDMRLDKEAVDSVKIEKAKTALSSGQPIVIAFKTTYSFCTTGVDSSGLWDKTKGWLYPTGGHAMCVIGYDDEKFGGAFEIQNSWGAEWGKDGYVWVKYADFAEYVYGAYVMELSDNIKSATTTVNCQMGNCQDGYCRYTFESGDVYEGEIKGKKFEGSGIYQWANGDVYVGNYVAGLKQGKGIYFFADGTMKKGYWAGDTLNEGMDYLEYTYGTVVSGESEFEGYQKADKWLFGELKKQSAYSSEVFTGTFAENKKDGFGITRNSWDMVYIGMVNEDRYSDYFAMISPKNEYAKIFNGQGYDWKKIESDAKLAASLKIPEESVADSIAGNEDKTKCTYGDCMNGYGTYKYASGNSYTGYFVNGYRQGYGVYTFNKDGKTVTYEGLYEGNEKSGIGKVKWSDTEFFIGEFVLGGLQGLGLYVPAENKAVAGTWDAGEFVKWETEFGFGDAVTDKDKQGSASATERNNRYRTQKQNHTQIE